MKLKLVIILILIVLVQGACKDEVALAPAKTTSIENFPNTVGLQWRYQVIDNLQDPINDNKPFLTIDTVDLAITGFTSNPAIGSITIWSQQRNNIPELEKLAQINGDTAYFVWFWSCPRPDTCYFDRIGIVFPFELGDSWATGGILSGDRTSVIDTTTISLAGATFHNVYVLENNRRTTISTYKRKMTLWFVPDFGIIKINLHEQHAQSVGDTTWTLLYHNNPNF